GLEAAGLLRQRRRRVRQRRDGDLLGVGQEGDPPHLGPLGDHHPLRAPNDPVRLHRGLLQPPTTPTPTRRPHPRRGLRCQPGSLIYRNPVSIRTGQLHTTARSARVATLATTALTSRPSQVSMPSSRAPSTTWALVTS